MTTGSKHLKACFRDTVRERRMFAPGTPDYDYRTHAARQLLWLMRGVPTSEWRE